MPASQVQVPNRHRSGYCFVAAWLDRFGSSSNRSAAFFSILSRLNSSGKYFAFRPQRQQVAIVRALRLSRLARNVDRY